MVELMEGEARMQMMEEVARYRQQPEHGPSVKPMEGGAMVASGELETRAEPRRQRDWVTLKD